MVGVGVEVEDVIVEPPRTGDLLDVVGNDLSLR